jgi:hypothetical protein
VALRAFTPERGRGPRIWLVGVTHFGTAGYYGEVQRFLDSQTVVFFEGVGATNKEFQSQAKEGYSLQAALAKALGLEFQLEVIDYTRSHFRNSDLSLAQLARLFGGAEPEEAPPATAGLVPGSESRGTSSAFDQLVGIMEGTGLWGGLARFAVAFIAASPRMQAAVKVAMIDLLSQLPDDLPQMAGLPPEFRRLLRVLIEERNRTVVRDLGAALRERPRPRSIAVFYGAGHMTDLEQRLRDTLGYRPEQERWLTAFGVRPRAAGLSQFELDLTRRLVRQQLQTLGAAGKRP